jgi:DNA anti-recombination protein RmuC
LLRSDANDAHKQSRNELSEFQDRLWVKFQEFADMLSKSATETVIEALNKVISDFNNNLTEQFGENFKELNAAVGKLVEWQDNYRGQIEQMTHQYAQGVAAIADTETAVARIHEHTTHIPESMAKLSEVMTVNQHQIAELGRHLEAFKDVRDRAVEAVPEIRRHIDMTVEGVQQASQQLVEGVTSSNKAFLEVISAGVTEFADNSARVNASLQTTSDVIHQGAEKTDQLFQDLTDNLHSNFRTLAAEMNEQSKSIGESLRDSGKAVVEEAARSRELFESGLEAMRNQLANNLERMAEQQASQIQGLVTGLKEAMEEAMRKSAQSVEGSVEILDQALQNEINRSMEQMGKALVSITGKFTEDYRGLVGQMDRVLRTQAS